MPDDVLDELRSLGCHSADACYCEESPEGDEHDDWDYEIGGEG